MLQVGPSWQGLDEEFRSHVAQLRINFLGWDYRFYSDQDMSDYIGEHCCDEENNAYNRLNPRYGPARADFFRYVIMRDHGGIYLDLKSGISKPINEVLQPLAPLPPLLFCTWGFPNQHDCIGEDLPVALHVL